MARLTWRKIERRHQSRHSATRQSLGSLPQHWREHNREGSKTGAQHRAGEVRPESFTIIIISVALHIHTSTGGKAYL